jgi:hypothetical protein
VHFAEIRVELEGLVCLLERILVAAGQEQDRDESHTVEARERIQSDGEARFGDGGAQAVGRYVVDTAEPVGG